jgi:ribosomal protein S18 acetylase RimI-like enzyme
MQALPELVSLLQDAVDTGASVGFLLPLTTEEAHSYWQEVILAIQKQSRILLVARREKAIVGTVQLDLVTQPNGIHRAEVQKLLVHRCARRHGLGRALMIAVEAAAREAGRSLLVLDTREGDPAEKLYLSLGYTKFGIVPQYARSPNGSSLDASVFYYRFI